MTTKARVLACSLGALLGAATSVAQAVEWRQYFENTKSVRFYIDQNSYVRLLNGNVQAWQKREREPGDGSLYLIEVNCGERKYFIKSISFVKKTPDNLKWIAEHADDYKEWVTFEPNELDEDTFVAWCRPNQRR